MYLTSFIITCAHLWLWYTNCKDHIQYKQFCPYRASCMYTDNICRVLRHCQLEGSNLSTDCPRIAMPCTKPNLISLNVLSFELYRHFVGLLLQSLLKDLVWNGVQLPLHNVFSWLKPIHFHRFLQHWKQPHVTRSQVGRKLSRKKYMNVVFGQWNMFKKYPTLVRISLTSPRGQTHSQNKMCRTNVYPSLAHTLWDADKTAQHVFRENKDRFLAFSFYQPYSPTGDWHILWGIWHSSTHALLTAEVYA